MDDYDRVGEADMENVACTEGKRALQMQKVSIILPVYNVGRYIDQCLESICMQKFSSLEIIIVYDQSTDDSLVKCRKWAGKDKRIHLIINENRRGLGAARNLGLSVATGTYIVYVDSDDWIDKDFIQILYDAIEQTEADYVSSIGFYEVRQGTESVRKRSFLPPGVYCTDIEKISVLLKDAPAVWKKIYRRKWLMEHHLIQPELLCYEDWGYDIALVLQTQKIVLIPEIGVYYRTASEGGLSDVNLEVICREFRKSIEFGLNQAERAGVSEKYYAAILKYLLRDYYTRKKMALAAKNERALQILTEIKSEIFERHMGFEEIDVYKRHICFGSFSLRWIVQETNVFENNLEHFGFSSMISAITPGETAEVKNKNIFRTEQVLADLTGRFEKVLETVEEKSVLFLDFLEERNHIIELDNHNYITESEAYLDSAVKGVCEINRLQSGTERFWHLWKEKCRILVHKLRTKRSIIDLVLVKNRMALCYGDLNGTKRFPGVQKLNNINVMLHDMEDYFLEQCRTNGISVKIFGLPEKFCFTDVLFEYGCEPQYMNQAFYACMGFEIFKKYAEEQRAGR